MTLEVEFYSEAFQPILPEGSQISFERYGAELTWWLCQKLAAEEIYTSYPNFEDWGWFLKYTKDTNEYRLCCGNIDSKENWWRVILQPRSKTWFGFKKISVTGAKDLLNAVDKVLTESELIDQIKWI